MNRHARGDFPTPWNIIPATMMTRDTVVTCCCELSREYPNSEKLEPLFNYPIYVTYQITYNEIRERITVEIGPFGDLLSNAMAETISWYGHVMQRSIEDNHAGHYAGCWETKEEDGWRTLGAGPEWFLQTHLGQTRTEVDCMALWRREQWSKKDPPPPPRGYRINYFRIKIEISNSFHKI